MKSKIFIALGLALTLFGCASKEKGAQSSGTSDSASTAFISSSAAVETNRDTTRKFIRTAELKFKVKSVLKATYDIENITNRQGGFVTFANLNSTIDNVSKVAVSEDSLLETTFFTVTNSITLRVPNTKLDTTLKLISNNIEYLDYRIIKAEDVALQILSNSLTQKRSSETEGRLTNAINNKGRTLNETTVAEDAVASKQEQADKAKISNLSLMDQINFSTINLLIYQRQTISRELTPNVENIDAYEPSFGSRILESIKFGWDIFESLIIFLVKLWGLFLFGFIVYFAYKKYGHKLKR